MASLAVHAVVVGGGIAGCLSAAVLSRHFARVTLLERDDSEHTQVRRGLPQATHAHVILRGGVQAMERALPGIEARLFSHGATKLQPAKDVLTITARGPLPRRAVGPTVPALSRLLLDRLVRAELGAIANVNVKSRSRVEGLDGDERRVRAVRFHSNAGTETLAADLVVDASGRTARGHSWLSSLGITPPPETRVHRKLRYATRVVRLAPRAANDAAISVFPTAENRRAGLLVPIEDGRFLLTLISPPALSPKDDVAFDDYVRALPSAQLGERLVGAVAESHITHFGFDGSCHRHFERLSRWPRNLLCVGDAVCNFNPVHGQGMSVAALQVQALAGLLDTRSAHADWDEALAQSFFQKAAEIIETPWELSTYPDLAEPDGSGVRPANFELRWAEQRALMRLAIEDGEVQGPLTEAMHLVRPWASLLAPPLSDRIAAIIQAQRERRGELSTSRATGGQVAKSARGIGHFGGPP